MFLNAAQRLGGGDVLAAATGGTARRTVVTTEHGRSSRARRRAESSAGALLARGRARLSAWIVVFFRTQIQYCIWPVVMERELRSLRKRMERAAAPIATTQMALPRRSKSPQRSKSPRRSKSPQHYNVSQTTLHERRVSESLQRKEPWENRSPYMKILKSISMTALIVAGVSMAPSGTSRAYFTHSKTPHIMTAKAVLTIMNLTAPEFANRAKRVVDSVVDSGFNMINGGRIPATDFWTTPGGELYAVKGKDPDFFMQFRSRVFVPLTTPGPDRDLNRDQIAITPQISRMAQIIDSGTAFKDPGSFSVETDSIVTVRTNVFTFIDSPVSISRVYFEGMIEKDPFLVLPPDVPIALVRWSSTLPSADGTPVPSMSTHTWSEWSWVRPYKLIIIPEPGTRLIPLGKYVIGFREGFFMEMVLMPGKMRWIRQLGNDAQGREQHLVSYSTPYAIGFGRGASDGRTHVVMADDLKAVEYELKARSITVDGLIPALKSKSSRYLSW